MGSRSIKWEYDDSLMAYTGVEAVSIERRSLNGDVLEEVSQSSQPGVEISSKSALANAGVSIWRG